MTLSDSPLSRSRPKPRVGWLDAFRGFALLAMASYHSIWDFEYFGYLDPGTAGNGLPKIYARMIATTFLFLAGFGLALAHRAGIRWDRFWIRFAKVAGAAVVITIATWFVMPQGFIHFGILHQIALASLVGLLFLRLPSLATLAVAVAIFAVPLVYRSPVFDHPLLWWTGLSPQPRLSFDYVPVFPWLAAVLAGIAVGRLDPVRAWLSRLPDPSPALKPFALAGRHSLIVYLLHQIPLFGLVYLLSLVAPPDRAASYTRECMQSCEASGGAALCQKFCSCTLTKLQAGDMLTPLQTGKIKVDDERIQSLALQCSMEAQQP